MANHKSSKKRVIRNEKKRLENKSRLSKIRTFVKKAFKFFSGGAGGLGGEEAKAPASGKGSALAAANSQLAKGVKTGVVSRRKMARTMSKLSKLANRAQPANQSAQAE
ncbi:MAG: 30S ribosomal protein S20 [Rickettsiales bacterium]|jgi:small subunit ribosomal protein S20|nr:30S ribosomal protein S20 [Rickettsiales bacterium]